MNNQNLQKLKAKHKLEMENYSQQVREYVNEYSNDNCDYLTYRRDMSIYHRGAWNALNELEKMEASESCFQRVCTNAKV